MRGAGFKCPQFVCFCHREWAVFDPNPKILLCVGQPTIQLSLLIVSMPDVLLRRSSRWELVK